MRHHAHGVAEVELGDVQAAVGADHEVDAQGAAVVGPNMFVEPRPDASADLPHGRKSGLYALIRPHHILFIHTAARLEIRIAGKNAVHVFQRQVDHRMWAGSVPVAVPHPVGFCDDAALVLDHLGYPVAVNLRERAVHPAQSPTRPRPRGFEHPVVALAQQSLHLYYIIYSVAVGLQGEDGGAVLEAADGGYRVVRGQQLGGDATLLELVLHHGVPAPYRQRGEWRVESGEVEVVDAAAVGFGVERLHEVRVAPCEVDSRARRNVESTTAGEAEVVLGVEDAELHE